MIQKWEEKAEFDLLLESLQAEHQPATPTELLLVENMAQHYWLKQRAIRLQSFCFRDQVPMCDDDHAKELALYLRYQTTHERAFYKALNQLVKLRAEQRRAEIGFESQKRQQEEHERKQAVEERKQDLHSMAVLMAEAKVDHQVLMNVNLQTDEYRITVDPHRIIAMRKAA